MQWYHAERRHISTHLPFTFTLPWAAPVGHCWFSTHNMAKGRGMELNATKHDLSGGAKKHQETVKTITAVKETEKRGEDEGEEREEKKGQLHLQVYK